MLKSIQFILFLGNIAEKVFHLNTKILLKMFHMMQLYKPKMAYSRDVLLENSKRQEVID